MILLPAPIPVQTPGRADPLVPGTWRRRQDAPRLGVRYLLLWTARLAFLGSYTPPSSMRVFGSDCTKASFSGVLKMPVLRPELAQEVQERGTRTAGAIRMR